MLKTSPPRVEPTWDLLLWYDLDHDHSKLLRSWNKMQTAATNITHELRMVWNNNLKFSWRLDCCSKPCVVHVLCLLSLFAFYFLLNWNGQRTRVFMMLLGSWCIKITDEPLVTYNEFIGFFDHDPSDLGWLILIYIIPKITHPYKRERILGTRLMSFATTWHPAELRPISADVIVYIMPQRESIVLTSGICQWTSDS